jgi:hypothetical protein
MAVIFDFWAYFTLRHHAKVVVLAGVPPIRKPGA